MRAKLGDERPDSAVGARELRMYRWDFYNCDTQEEGEINTLGLQMSGLVIPKGPSCFSLEI